MNIEEINLTQDFQNHINHNLDLQSCVCDASVYDKTLVVLCGCDQELSVIRSMLSRYWSGNIEVYRLSEIATGLTSLDVGVSILNTSELLH
jgi:hypothetical protein